MVVWYLGSSRINSAQIQTCYQTLRCFASFPQKVNIRFETLGSDLSCLISSNFWPCGYLNSACLHGHSFSLISSWVVIMARALPCGGFNRSSLLQSNDTGFEIQAILDETISCPPSPPHQIWVTCSHRFAIAFNSLQGLSYGASVPRHPGLPCWHTPGFRSCKSHLEQPGNTCVLIWNHESASSYKELNSKAVKLLAALWAQPLPNKVKLV